MIVKVSPFFAHKSTRRCRLSTAPRRSSAKRATTALLAPPDERRVPLFSTLDENAIMSFDPSLPPPSGMIPIHSFEPVLNLEAASSFAFVAIVFAMLQLRINAVSDAARRRSAALSALRAAESARLSDPAIAGDRAVGRARVEYENALREELGLRTILPGVRIAAPNDPGRDEEERANAKRFLGWGREEFGYDDDDDVGEGGNIIGTGGSSRGSVDRVDGNSRKDERSDVGLSVGAKFILFGVASMLIVLLWTLSFDPMAADTSFFG